MPTSGEMSIRACTPPTALQSKMHGLSSQREIHYQYKSRVHRTSSRRYRMIGTLLSNQSEHLRSSISNHITTLRNDSAGSQRSMHQALSALTDDTTKIRGQFHDLTVVRSVAALFDLQSNANVQRSMEVQQQLKMSNLQ